jgi:hypothetical protein
VPALRSFTTNFTAGELSPRLLARSDLAKYQNGASGVQNMLIQPHGGATRRPGSYYVGAAYNQDPASPALLWPFVVSRIAAYVLEIGHLYVRFYRNRAPILASGTPLTIGTPWPASALSQLRFNQSADVLYILHPSYRPMKLSRIAADQFTLAQVTFQDGPYLPENTGAPGYSSGSSTTSSAGTSATVPTPSGDTSGGTDPGGGSSTGGDAGGGGGSADSGGAGGDASSGDGSAGGEGGGGGSGDGGGGGE